MKSVLTTIVLICAITLTGRAQRIPSYSADKLMARTANNDTTFIINFWATWCGPCVREFPLLRQAAAAHRADRLAVVGVLTNDRPAAARDFVRAHGATWPIALDPTAATAGRWGAVGLPHTWFIRPDGTLASHQLGELTGPALDRQLSLILR